MAASSRADGRIRSTLVGFGLAVLAVLIVNVIVTPVVLIEPGAADPAEPADRTLTVLTLILNFVGFFVAGAIYLAVTDRGWSFVDLRTPTSTDWLWTVASTVGAIVFILAFGLLVQALDAPQAPNEVVMFVDDTTMLLVMIGIVIFFNAPAEEFFFRNVIQKRLYESFSVGGAIVVASVIFTLIHVPAFLAAGVTAAAVSLFALFCGSVIFGYAYAKTGNLIVPTIAHAGLNVFQFGILYVQLEYGEIDDPEELAMVFEAGLALVPV